jgi:hypothetical protein
MITKSSVRLRTEEKARILEFPKLWLFLPCLIVDFNSQGRKRTDRLVMETMGAGFRGHFRPRLVRDLRKFGQGWLDISSELHEPALLAGLCGA